MDILTLNIEEALLIHVDNEWVKVTPFKSHEPGQVKLGIEAPRSIKVHREEVYKALNSSQTHEEKK